MFTMGYNCMAALFQISKKHKFYVDKLLYARKLLLKFARNKRNPIIGLDINFKLKKKKILFTINQEITNLISQYFF